VDQTDETVTTDAELLDWFSTRTWWDLSIAMSMAMKANVEFPDREEGWSHDPDDPFTLLVYDNENTVDYPLTIREFLITALETYDEASCVQAWQALEDAVEDVEGIRLSITRKPFAPWSDDGDFLATEYRFHKEAPGTWTVARWRDKRLATHLPTQAVLDITYPDGAAVAGQTRLATLRAVWSGHDARDRRPPDDPDRQFEVMRDARWIGYVRSVISDE
jgi:hypothetical protein